MTETGALALHEARQPPWAGGRLPLLGHVPSLVWDLPGLMRSLAAGEGRLRRVSLPAHFDVHVWSSPESFSLLKNQETSSASAMSVGDLIAGTTSMLSSDGDAHRHRRRASSRPFTPKGLSMSGVSAVIRDVVETRVGELMAQDGVTLLDLSQRVALEIIFRVMGVPQDALRSWARNYNTMLRCSIGPRWDLPLSPYRRGLRARAWVDARLAEYVAAARRDPSAEGLVAELVRGRDDEGRALSEPEIFDNLRLMILAGHETTASVIAWMASYAALLPEVHARLMEEAVAGEGLPLTPKALREFPFTEAVFREALRLHPPATLSTRVALQPMEIEGYTLPEGAVLGVPIWLLCRDPSLFEEPERFSPERWLREDRRYSALETCAFGGGPHFCLGYHMALLEGVQFTVALMRGLHETGRSLRMKALPRERYLPLLRPRMSDTRCDFVPRPG